MGLVGFGGLRRLRVLRFGFLKEDGRSKGKQRNAYFSQVHRVYSRTCASLAWDSGGPACAPETRGGDVLRSSAVRQQ